MKHTFASRYKQTDGPIYLDCNATAPIEPKVRDAVFHWMAEEIGNAGSRTHEYGLQAKRAIQHSRDQVSKVVDAAAEEVIFTSGATESNNLAILGLAEHGLETSRRHIVSTAIEHKAVLEPLEALEARGFTVTLVPPNQNGEVSASAIKDALRPDTLLVSVMHANNETGSLQPIQEIAESIKDHHAFIHVDAAQGYGKDLGALRNERIDLISVSGHKIYGPLGIGALIARRRHFKRPPLKAIMYGGGQERGLRPGTLPVPLIVGLGIAAETALKNQAARQQRCYDIRQQALAALEPLGIQLHSNPDHTLPHVMNFSVPGVDSEAVMLALKDIVAISNGSACTSQSYTPSHVLAAMGLPDEDISGAIRISWSHLTPDVDWSLLAARLDALR